MADDQNPLLYNTGWFMPPPVPAALPLDLNALPPGALPPPMEHYYPTANGRPVGLGGAAPPGVATSPLSYPSAAQPEMPTLRMDPATGRPISDAQHTVLPDGTIVPAGNVPPSGMSPQYLQILAQQRAAAARALAAQNAPYPAWLGFTGPNGGRNPLLQAAGTHWLNSLQMQNPSFFQLLLNWISGRNNSQPGQQQTPPKDAGWLIM